MKSLSAIWTFGCFLVIFGGVNSDTIVYPGRAALLSYNPARGEFPVQSLFGGGYFSYIDESGNSRIVALEPNPLLGVRVSGNGLPQIEIGRKIDLDNQVKEGGQNYLKAVPCEDNRKQDRLKPIKEFDENPFVDSINQEDVSTPAPGDSRIVFSNPGPSPIQMNKDSLPALPKATVPGQEPQIFYYPPPTASPMVGIPVATVTPQVLPNTFPPAIVQGLSNIGSSISPQVFPNPPLPVPVQGSFNPSNFVSSQGLPNPSSPSGGLFNPSNFVSSQGLPNPSSPSMGLFNPLNSVSSQLVPNPSSPLNPFLPLNMGNPFLPLNMGLMLPNPSQSNTSEPALVNSTTPGGVFPNPTPPANSGASTSIPAISEILFPNSPLLTGLSSLQGLGPFSRPPTTASSITTSPIIGILSQGNPFLPTGTTLPPATVFPNPPPPPTSPGAFLNPPPPRPSGNPFLPLDNNREKPPSWTAPATTKPPPQFNVDMKNPFLPRPTRIDIKSQPLEVQPTSSSLNLESSSSHQEISPPTSITLDSDAPPEPVKDTPEVEQAKREHFLAHELALAQLELIRQQSNDQEDESSSPLAAASDSSSVYLMADGTLPQAVTSGPSTVTVTEQTKPAETDAVTGSLE